MYIMLIWKKGDYLDCVRNADGSITLFNRKEAVEYIIGNSDQIGVDNMIVVPIDWNSDDYIYVNGT